MCTTLQNKHPQAPSAIEQQPNTPAGNHITQLKEENTSPIEALD
jgi:hypothetical protein